MRTAVLGVLVAIGTLSLGVVRAQQNVIDIRLEKVRDNLYIITGGRAMPAQGGISGVTTVFLACRSSPARIGWTWTTSAAAIPTATP